MSQFGRSSLGPQASRLQTHGSARFRDLAGETPAVPEKSVRKLSGVVKTYINGSLKHTFSGTGAIGDANTTWNDFRIGGRQATSQHFQGRIDEVRVYNRALSASEVGLLPGGNNVPQIYWLVTDQLGTPRMVLDHTGDLNTMKRHDYLPFGEELFAPTGGRSVALGYSVGDGIRQQFTSRERDVETGLDYFGARYYSSSQGRFTTPDEFAGGPDELYTFAEDAEENPTFYADPGEPQSLNKYQYCYNNPLAYLDLDGHAPRKPSAEMDNWDSEPPDNWDLPEPRYWVKAKHRTPRRPVRPPRLPRIPVGNPKPAYRRPVPMYPGSPPAIGAPGSPAPWGSHLSPKNNYSWGSFSHFKRLAGSIPNYQWHHVVEQHPSNTARFGEWRINTSGNLIPVHISVHRQISAYYSSKRAFTEGKTVREWLKTQTFEQQHAFGLQVLRDFGVIP